jgi:RNA polymerase sigma-70 factor (ECF subfamily)
LDTENEILKRLKNNDPEVIELIYKEYSPMVYSYLLVKTKGDKDMAGEILSETFCSLIETRQNLAHTNNIKSYLLKIAFRRFCDFFRKKYRHDKQDKLLVEDDHVEDTHVDVLHEKEQKLMVNLAMDKLKPEYCEILKLKYIDGKSQNEIATLMNKTVSAVENMLLKARNNLRKELGKFKGFNHE